MYVCVCVGVCVDWGMGNGSRRMFTFKPLIPPLISSAAFSPWAPGGLLVVVVGVDMVVIKVQVLLFRGLGWGCSWLAKGCS